MSLQRIRQEYLRDCFELNEGRSEGVHDSSVQTDSLVRVPGRHVGNNDRIADLKTLQDLDGANGAAPEFYRDSNRSRAAVNDFEDPDCAIGLSLHRTAHKEHVVEPLQFDRTIHTQVRPS